MQERLKILELVAEGKLTAEQADLLLEALTDKSKGKADGKTAWDKAANDLKGIGSQLSSVIAQSMTELRRGLETNLSNLSFGDHIAASVEREFSADMKALRVETTNGRIRVERCSGPHIRMYVQADVRVDEQDKAKELLEQAIQVTETGQEVDLRFLQRVDGARVAGGRIDLYVPDHLQNLVVHTRNGDIFVHRATVQTLELDSTNGQIHVHHARAEVVRATSQNGLIQLHDALQTSTSELYAESKNGTIQLRGLPSDRALRGKALSSVGTVQVSHPELDVVYDSEHRPNSCTFRLKEEPEETSSFISVYLETKSGKISVQQ
ncbi:DUF4097 family beta strand repeat-containing protein [Alicyclobacillus fastidiosus]|uniref:DUF4097 family beta strand repeat-containing protein n=1 Tax=Alicyclobacillus fastidiosus TaxID=392011 RepID=A0ABY6ZND1_9BACL|nr:DUF4097 family beta strand repeat-containing protein [Alicyclobacillus fastidiosus]WAH43686.1 DUF4097 family beta strand repeat-containing protein [Alicyclobacillus fastidiosus]GMA59893.1 hypothetical protein GCM10025859_03330 [Alicyclobacillus fastidiosus]